ncbi:MAG: hypothetical protein IJA91_05210, partial [Clostridia bacterium]|nr:hypothetical protein [Clostridia bacterium]
IWANLRPPGRVWRDLVIIAHPFPFVKRFFEISFGNFSLPFSVGGSALTLYHSLPSLSRGFSKVFSTFLQYSASPSLHGYPLLDSLHIIALHPPFVKCFLSSFSGLAVWAILHNYIRLVLCI